MSPPSTHSLVPPPPFSPPPPRLSVLGLLVRHATYIAEELAQTSVVEVLTEALKVGALHCLGG